MCWAFLRDSLFHQAGGSEAEVTQLRDSLTQRPLGVATAEVAVICPIQYTYIITWNLRDGLIETPSSMCALFSFGTAQWSLDKLQHSIQIVICSCHCGAGCCTRAADTNGRKVLGVARHQGAHSNLPVFVSPTSIIHTTTLPAPCMF